MNNKFTCLPALLLKFSLLITCNDVSADTPVMDNTENSNVIEPVEVGRGGHVMPERDYRTKTESLFKWHAHMFYEGRYVTEGRDNLSGEGLFSASTEFSADNISVVPWIAHSANMDYTELDLNLIYGTSLSENLTVFLGYTNIHTKLKDDRTSDNEISLDATYKLVSHVTMLTSIYYSFDADGSFVETSVAYDSEISNKIYYGAQAVLGINAGYIPDGHDGFNNFQLQTNLSYIPLDRVELHTFVAYNWAIDRDVAKHSGDESLKNFLWAGIGASYLF